MRKILTFVVVFAITMGLSACSLDPYKSDYDEGYDFGYEVGYDYGYERGYEDGYDEGKLDGSALEEEGIHYAREHSGWSPEEAMYVIEAYQTGKSCWKDGSLPSHEEYLDAIESLIYFYDYFYSVKYN